MPKENQVKGCKSAAFSVEIIVDQLDCTTLIVRNMNGQPLQVLPSAESLVDFLEDCVVKMQSPDKTASE